MDSTPDYSRCSLRELEDVAARVDRAKYPDRYALVLREIERRETTDAAVASSPQKLRGFFAAVPSIMGGALGFFLFCLTPIADVINPDSAAGIIEATAAIVMGALIGGVAGKIWDARLR